MTVIIIVAIHDPNTVSSSPPKCMDAKLRCKESFKDNANVIEKALTAVITISSPAL